MGRHTEIRSPIDVCLATNMIQVGLDVPRLGLMTVVGQPKTTSEYIQATSRVGRSHPGLVVTVYNPSKPRDRSHFEHFRSYHETIYRWVEPTSVTPFAVPVRDRAIHALAVTLVRYFGGDAARTWPQPWKPVEDLVPRVTEVIAARVRVIDPDEEDAARQQLKEIFTTGAAIHHPVMVTSSRHRPIHRSCIRRALRSLRNGANLPIRRRVRCAMSIRPAMPACFPGFLSRRRTRCLPKDLFVAASSSLHSGWERWSSFPRDEALMTAGLDAWTAHAKKQCPPDWLIREERLEARLGVSHLRLPPDHRDSGVGVQFPNQDVPFVRFPRWHYCHYCGGMEELSLFGNRQRCRAFPWPTRNCVQRARKPWLIPVRFVTACPRGHVQDFPFMAWVHRGLQRGPTVGFASRPADRRRGSPVSR